MFCEECSKELTPGKTFCTNCGAPVRPGEPAEPEKAPAAPGAPVPPVVPGVTPYKPGLRDLRDKFSNKTLVIAGAVGLGIIVIILLLTLVVFKGGGGSPQDVVGRYLMSFEKKDTNALMETMDMDFFKGETDLEKRFKDEVFKDVPKEGIKFSGLKYETKIEGDKATVKVTGGSATYKEGGKDKTTELSKANINDQFELVKKGGNWYISPKIYMAAWAKEYMASGDKQMDAANSHSDDFDTELTSLLTDFEGGKITSSAQFKERSDEVKKISDKIVKEAEKAEKEYKKISGLKGVDDYAEYAKLKTQFIKKAEEVLEKTLDLLDYTLEAIVTMESGQPLDQNAFTANVEKMSSEIVKLSEEAEKLDQKAEDLKEEKNL